VSGTTAVPIGDIVSKVATCDPRTDLAGTWFEYIDISSINRESKRIEGSNKIAGEVAPSRARQMIRAKDILVSTVRPNLNAVAQVPDELESAIASTGFTVLRPKEAVVHSRYLFHWVRSRQFVAHMIENATGASYPAVSDRIVKESLIPLLPLNEQLYNAAILDKADALREKQRQAINTLDTLRQSIFLDMFGDPVSNPKGWSKYALTDLCVGKYGIKAGPFGSSLKKDTYSKAGYRIYGQEQVIGGDFNIGDYFINQAKFDEMRAYEVQGGDVLMSLVGTIGRLIVVPEDIQPGIINPRLLKITPRRSALNSHFLCTLLSSESIQRSFATIAHGGTMNILNASLLKQVEIILPPLPLQENFSLRLKKLRGLQSRFLESGNTANCLFESLQQRAFNGELQIN
jgi:type I restriction enzyme, S subunit